MDPVRLTYALVLPASIDPYDEAVSPRAGRSRRGTCNVFEAKAVDRLCPGL